MVQQMMLRGQVRMNMDRTYTFLSEFYDGTPFECEADFHDFQQQDPFAPGEYVVWGWLFVVQEGRQEDRCYITLPRPSLTHGRQVLVRAVQLMSRGASINDFRPRLTSRARPENAPSAE